MSLIPPLAASQLRWICDPRQLRARDTTEIQPIEGVVGQESAVEALAFGLDVQAPGQHVFVRGLVGTGRLTLVRNHLRGLEDRANEAQDRAYVHNFTAPDRPRLLSFPRGDARAFAAAMERVEAFVREELPRATAPSAQGERRRSIDLQAQQEMAQLAGPLEARLAEAGLALAFRNGDGASPTPVLLPVVDGRPLSPEALSQAVKSGELSPEKLEEYGRRAQGFVDDLDAFVAAAAALSARHRERVEGSARAVARVAIEDVLRPILARFPSAAAWLGALADDLVNHRLKELSDPKFTRLYAVNIISGHEDATRPVIVENVPSIPSLLGSIDMAFLPDGSAGAPHMGLHAGSLVRADGGTLILDARDLASAPGAWQALVRCLRSGTVELAPLNLEATTRRTPGLKPDPIPVSVKVVLLGEADVYHTLDNVDPDFRHLFKVLVDFDDILPRSPASLDLYAGVFARLCRDEGLLPLAAEALAALFEHGARIAARPEVVTARFGRVADIAREAAWLAKNQGQNVVLAEHVRDAVRRTKERAGLPARHFQDRVRRGILQVAVQGHVVGQVNGLATTRAGQLTYGFPSRITATVGPGARGTINIEGEASLSGAIHTKAFHILGGALRSLLPTPHPLVFDASIAFEQSYGGIDGDSASGAETVVLLSALTGLPLAQGLAMTGAIDQHGNILPIGAVNEKIEGFYDVCAASGLTGDQGVIIPASNVGDLMLRHDLVEACRAGRFSVWAVSHIREALTLFTGVPGGLLDEDGRYPPGTVLFRAMGAARRLHERGVGAAGVGV